LAIALLGFFDAAYLTVKHYTGGALECSVLNGCEQVTTSKYSAIGPVPISLVGAVYYLVLLVLAFAYLDFEKPKLMYLAALLATLGFLASGVLVYLQVFVINALCLYCLFSAGFSTLLFILGLAIVWSLSRILKIK
jgi:uncharacterized membrane protein